MIDSLILLGCLLLGQAIHLLGKTYELDKATAESITPLDVAWAGPEKWKTLSSIGVMGLLAFTNSTAMLLSILGVTVESIGDAWLLFAAVGYNVDSIAGKLFAIGKAKEAP